MSLQKYKDLGVKELRVTNKEAVAVNPWTKGTIYHTRFNANFNLPPLPCPTVEDGTYEIGMFEEEVQYRDDDGFKKMPNKGFSINAYAIRTVLVLKEQVVETDLQKAIEYALDDNNYEQPIEVAETENELMMPLIPRITEYSTDSIEKKIKALANSERPIEVAEKPEGESFLTELLQECWRAAQKEATQRYDGDNPGMSEWIKVNSPTPSEAQPVKPEGEIIREWIPSKNWTEDSLHENGNYTCECHVCNYIFIGHKRRVTCKECASKQPEAQPVESALNRKKMDNEKMPLTIIEQLELIPDGGYLILSPDLPPRASWQQKISELKKRSRKRFSIRTGVDGIARVWRLDDEPQ